MTSLKPLGGYFETEELVPEENRFFDQLTPEGGDLRFLMSGRCGILCALEETAPHRKLLSEAFLPM